MGGTNSDLGTLSRGRKLRARVGTNPRIKEAARQGGFCAHFTVEGAEVQTLRGVAAVPGPRLVLEPLQASAGSQ